MTYERVANCQVVGLEEIYEKYFGYRNHGQFVEIGAYDGINFSNTFGLLRAGWNGLYAEPVEEFYKLCVENLKEYNATVHRVAIGNKDGNVKMVVAGTISTYDDMQLQAPVWKFDYARSSKTELVPITTLDHFLMSNRIFPAFDLLVIDTEGSELAVLQGFYLKLWQPKMVIVEAHEHSPYKELTTRAPEINKYFAENYTKIYSDEVNNIYVKGEV